MEIKDPKGKYAIKVDVERRISWETNMGVWAQEDLDRFQNDYAAKVIPLFKGKDWAICSDVRQYKTSPIEMDKHVAWKAANGAKLGVVIVESAIVKLQMNKSSSSSGLPVQAVIDEKEAGDYMKSKGF